MGSKLIEDVKIQQAIYPTGGTASTCLYNGSAVSVSNNGIDTLGYDEIIFTLSYGTAYTGSVLNAYVVGATTNNPSGATTVTLLDDTGASATATFTGLTTTSDQIQKATIKANNANRYLWLKTYQDSVTVNFSAVAILKATSMPVNNSPVFEIGFAG